MVLSTSMSESTPSGERRAIDSPLEQKVQRSLTYCWQEGIAAQVMVGIVDYYLIPFALVLGATNQQVGLLVGIPNFLSSIFQLFAVGAVHLLGSRLRLLNTGLFIQAVFLLPVGLLAYLTLPHPIGILIVLITIYKIIGSLIGPAWGSLVSEYLPAHRRGAYFGWRSRVLGIAGLINIVIWGAFLYYWKRGVNATSGFLILFLVAGLARFIGLGFM